MITGKRNFSRFKLAGNDSAAAVVPYHDAPEVQEARTSGENVVSAFLQQLLPQRSRDPGLCQRYG